VSGQTERVFHISPNLSLTPRGAVYFYLCVLFGTVIVSGGVAMAGFWPVLPFAGFELALLGGVLYSIQRRGSYREVLRIANDKIVVEKGEKSVQERVEFARHWAAVEIALVKGAVDSSKLLITGHGKRCIVGECLSETERRGLARRLMQVIGPFNSSPPLVATSEDNDPR